MSVSIRKNPKTCRECRKRAPVSGFALCAQCRSLCRKCKLVPATPGYTLCSDCYNGCSTPGCNKRALMHQNVCLECLRVSMAEQGHTLPCPGTQHSTQHSTHSKDKHTDKYTDKHDDKQRQRHDPHCLRFRKPTEAFCAWCVDVEARAHAKQQTQSEHKQGMSEVMTALFGKHKEKSENESDTEADEADTDSTRTDSDTPARMCLPDVSGFKVLRYRAAAVPAGTVTHQNDSECARCGATLGGDGVCGTCSAVSGREREKKLKRRGVRELIQQGPASLSWHQTAPHACEFCGDSTRNVRFCHACLASADYERKLALERAKADKNTHDDTPAAISVPSSVTPDAQRTPAHAQPAAGEGVDSDAESEWEMMAMSPSAVNASEGKRSAAVADDDDAEADGFESWEDLGASWPLSVEHDKERKAEKTEGKRAPVGASATSAVSSSSAVPARAWSAAPSTARAAECEWPSLAESARRAGVGDARGTHTRAGSRSCRTELAAAERPLYASRTFDAWL